MKIIDFRKLTDASYKRVQETLRLLARESTCVVHANFHECGALNVTATLEGLAHVQRAFTGWPGKVTEIKTAEWGTNDPLNPTVVKPYILIHPPHVVCETEAQLLRQFADQVGIHLLLAVDLTVAQRTHRERLLWNLRNPGTGVTTRTA